MRIVHVSESDLHGGASRSAYRVQCALLAAGADSHFLVGQKLSSDPTVAEVFPSRGATLRRRLRERLDAWPLRHYPDRAGILFSTAWASSGARRTILSAAPDLVHLHWINHGLLARRDIARLEVPLVWSLWDQWPFTGGCHYSGSCSRYTAGCGACPALGSTAEKDLSADVLSAKRRAWRGLRLETVAPSRWLADRARASNLFGAVPCTVLAQPIDPAVFRPLPRDQARMLLGLDPSAALIVLGADALGERRKGFDLASAALATAVFPAGAEPLLFTFGDLPPKAPDRLGAVPVRHLGRLRDELTVALAFSAADVALVPSREDAGPQVTVEALACGTPVVGFPVGVTADLVRHEANGWLASSFDPAGLAAGLRWALARRNDPALRTAARAAAVAAADVHAQVPEYLSLYRRLLAAAPGP